MKLTAETTAILKNYATINQNIQFKEGNTLSTISPQKNILTKAEISETIPKTFAIYDLNRLLGALSRLNDPDIEIGKEQLTVDGLKYTYAESAMLVLPPDKKLDVPNPEIKFEMTKSIFEDCIGMAQVLSLPNLVVEGDGTKINLVAIDTSLPSSDVYREEVGTTNEEFKMVFKIENMKLLSGDYRVEISSKGIGHFMHKTSKIEYWIATEQNSNYNN